MIGMDLAQQIRIGCSGWQYKHWRADFYPADLPQSRWFAHYARHFDTVERPEACRTRRPVCGS